MQKFIHIDRSAVTHEGGQIRAAGWRSTTQDCLKETGVTVASGYSVPETKLHGFRPLAPLQGSFEKH